MLNYCALVLVLEKKLKIVFLPVNLKHGYCSGFNIIIYWAEQFSQR